MNMNTKNIGIIVGRFQVAELHEGHQHLIDYARHENDEVAIVLGQGAALLSGRNPLPPLVRTRVIQDQYPGVKVFEHYDHPSDLDWSTNLDTLLTEEFPQATLRLYASRDSFIPHYRGALPVITVPELEGLNGTLKRAELYDTCDWSRPFREGMIAAQHLRPALSYQTVDIAVVRHATGELLLGQKTTDGGKWRLVGGFVDATDESLEGAALRELKEEAGNVLTHEVTYLGSYRIDDWRYRGEKDKILTSLFLTYHMGGVPSAGDDLAKVEWHALEGFDIETIVESHRPLVKRVLDALKK
jgi:bifunctional NMN adenylyltransferase/nudix hydrolase